MITPQKSLRYLINQRLNGGAALPASERWRDALIARRCRNLFFGAMAPVVYGTPPTEADIIVQAQTQPFADPVIVTDILNFTEKPLFDGQYMASVRTLMRLFTTGLGAQEDFFAAGNFTNTIFTLGHYQTSDDIDGASYKIEFAPYLMGPGQTFQAQWELLDYIVTTHPYNGEIHFRALQVMKQEDPYGQLCGTLKDQVCNYIERYNSETFILNVELAIADFPTAGNTVTLRTPLQERPLLILGVATNINGAQVQMRDDSIKWNFVASPVVPTRAVNNGVPTAGVYPRIVGLPLSVLAANSDLTLHEAYNMLPVPHLLAPGASLKIDLTSGIRPIGSAATFDQTMNTLSTLGISTGPGQISFLCRTV